MVTDFGGMRTTMADDQPPVIPKNEKIASLISSEPASERLAAAVASENSIH